jgi:hypothetical protein
MPRSSALAKFVTSVKGEDKAKSSIPKFLEKVISDFCLSGEFDAYLDTHADDMAKYLRKPDGPRPGLFRCSSAGKCAQAEVFQSVHEPPSDKVARPARQMRALHNGTFTHVRYHMLFDALHQYGIVRTLAAEEPRYEINWELSGSIDRLIEFEFDGKTTRAVVDFKSIKRQYFEALFEPKADHARQQHGYALLGWGADMWIMLYECKDSHDLKIYDRPYDDALTIELADRYTTAQQWIEDYTFIGPENSAFPVELPRLVLNTDWCRYCEWQTRCLVLNPERDTK